MKSKQKWLTVTAYCARQHFGGCVGRVCLGVIFSGLALYRHLLGLDPLHVEFVEQKRQKFLPIVLEIAFELLVSLPQTGFELFRGDLT